MTADFRDTQHGLTTERQWHINAMLRDYDPKLSLRRIPELDPAAIAGAKLNPPKLFGVWEEGVARGETNWVFTLAEMSIDSRVLARIMENDMSKQGADQRMAKFLAIKRAEEASKLKGKIDEKEAKREEMLWLGKQTKSSIRHTINGEKVIIADRIIPVKGKSL